MAGGRWWWGAGARSACEVREGKAFQYFGCWAQERDESIVVTFICRFASFRDGNDESLLPDVVDLGFGD